MAAVLADALALAIVNIALSAAPERGRAQNDHNDEAAAWRRRARPRRWSARHTVHTGTAVYTTSILLLKHILDGTAAGFA
mgnify:CR=1 FL=1